MALATLTSKGQVTIPKEIRESLHLHTGDKIEILVKESGEAVIRPICQKVDDIFCILKNINQKALSIDEMDQAIKKKLRGKFP